jgi:hypothetical protein
MHVCLCLCVCVCVCVYVCVCVVWISQTCIALADIISFHCWEVVPVGPYRTKYQKRMRHICHLNPNISCACVGGSVFWALFAWVCCCVCEHHARERERRYYIHVHWGGDESYATTKNKRKNKRARDTPTAHPISSPNEHHPHWPPSKKFWPSSPSSLSFLTPECPWCLGFVVLARGTDQCFIIAQPAQNCRNMRTQTQTQDNAADENTSSLIIHYKYRTRLWFNRANTDHRIL